MTLGPWREKWFVLCQQTLSSTAPGGQGSVAPCAGSCGTAAPLNESSPDCGSSEKPRPASHPSTGGPGGRQEAGMQTGFLALLLISCVTWGQSLLSPDTPSVSGRD